MNSRAWAALLLCFVCETSFADTLVMKSGENKKGKVLEETERGVLFNSQADGVVTEVPRSQIAIVDKDVASESASSKGSLQVFSVAPKKETKKKGFFQALEKEGQEAPEKPSEKMPQVGKEEGFNQSAAFQSLTKSLEDWVRSHPEAEKYIQEWMEKFKSNKDNLDKLVKTAKEA